MVQSPKTKKLSAAAQEALQHVADALDIPLNVGLWDGSVTPLGKEPARANLTIRTPGVIASLLKRPTLENLVRHYATENITFDGDLIATGTAVRAKIKKKDLKRLNKALLLSRLWPFLLVKGESAAPRHGFDKDDTGASHSNKNNQAYIQFHYDVSNEFYKLFLDKEMLYSCAYFTDWNNSIDQAQQDKLEMICRKLRLKPGERFLDIGCGWGALICYAARHYGVKAHGITLSQQQHDHAKEKIRALGLEDRVTVEIRDYLKLEGSYDKIASIGMFEHIGIANFPAYFKKIHSLLADRGLVLNHAIARRSKKDFKKALSGITPEKRLILKYIFPGSELAPVGYSANVMEAHGFEIHDVEGWREHYALTCKLWCERLTANKDKAIALVGPERYNLWVAYLAGVSFGFSSGSILIYQTLASKRAKEKGTAGLPPTRADLYR